MAGTSSDGILIKTVIMPIISFTGAIVDLPDLIEKQLAKIVFEFLWGKTTLRQDPQNR